MTVMPADYVEKLKKLAQQYTVDTSFAAGFDAGKNGIDLFNADFRLFRTVENKEAWERGKAMAEAEAEALKVPA